MPEKAVDAEVSTGLNHSGAPNGKADDRWRFPFEKAVGVV